MKTLLLTFSLIVFSSAPLAQALFYYDGPHKIALTPVPTTEGIQSKSANDSGLTFKNAHGHNQSLREGIIIQFHSDWDEQEINEWLDQNNLTPQKILIASVNLWMINAPAEVSTIQRANQIQESGEVIAATPNWSKNLILK